MPKDIAKLFLSYKWLNVIILISIFYVPVNSIIRFEGDWPSINNYFIVAKSCAVFGEICLFIALMLMIPQVRVKVQDFLIINHQSMSRTHSLLMYVSTMFFTLHIGTHVVRLKLRGMITLWYEYMELISGALLFVIFITPTLLYTLKSIGLKCSEHIGKRIFRITHIQFFLASVVLFTVHSGRFYLVGFVMIWRMSLGYSNKIPNENISVDGDNIKIQLKLEKMHLGKYVILSNEKTLLRFMIPLTVHQDGDNCALTIYGPNHCLMRDNRPPINLKYYGPFGNTNSNIYLRRKCVFILSRSSESVYDGMRSAFESTTVLYPTRKESKDTVGFNNVRSVLESGNHFKFHTNVNLCLKRCLITI